MSRQRYIDTCFWDDSYVIHLDPSEKLLFLYLLTNPVTTICGIYEISIKRISFDTGFENDTVKRILGRFEKDGRCSYRDGWLAMRNWIKHQKDAPGVQRGIALQLEKVPKELAEYVGEGLTPVRPPLDPHINVNDNININTKPMPKFSFTLEEGFVGIPYEDMQRWAETYPAVNIAGEIKKAAEWMRSNPTKRKSNYRRFLTNWFSRTQERGGTAGYRPPTARPAAVQVAQPQPLSEAERKENLDALGDLQRRLAQDKRLSGVGGKR